MQIANINNCYIFVELMLQLSEKYGQDPSLPKIDNHRLKAVGEEFHNLASQMYVFEDKVRWCFIERTLLDGVLSLNFLNS